MAENVTMASVGTPNRKKRGGNDGENNDELTDQTGRKLAPYSPRKNAEDISNASTSRHNRATNSSDYFSRHDKSPESHLAAGNSVPPNPPSLLPKRGNGVAFNISNHDVVKREEIK